MMGCMIAYLIGTVSAKSGTFLVLEVHGVGYKVHTTPRTLDGVSVGDPVSLHTHLAVREDAMELFGFPTHGELSFFELLIGISGIGPRSALGIVGLDSVEKLAGAIAHGDVAYLTKVSGVGKKSAEKIVLELRDKVTTLEIHDHEDVRRDEGDALEALKALGYRTDDAREALRQVPDDIEGQGARIKEALRLLSHH